MKDQDADAAAGSPRADASRQQVVAAAAKLFREQGYAATSLRTIASAVGMKAGSLYYHFSSKEHLAAEVLRMGIDAVNEHVRRTVDALASGTPSRRKIETAIRAHLESLLAHGDFTSATIKIFSQVPEEIRSENLATRDAYEDYWRVLLREAVEDGTLARSADLSALRLFILGSMNWTLEWYQSDRRLSVEALAQRFAGFLLDGAGGKPLAEQDSI